MNIKYIIWKCIIWCPIALTTLIAFPAIKIEQLKKEIGKSKSADLKKLLPDLFKKVPSSIEKKFGNFELANISIEEKKTISAVKDIHGTLYPGRASLSGMIKLGKIDVKATINVYEDRMKNNIYSLIIEMPRDYSIADLIPKLKLLKELSLPRIKLIFSEFSFIDADQVVIGEGVNLAALLDLKGPFKLFDELKNKAKELQSIVVDMNKPIQLTGKLPMTLDSFSFGVVIPIRFGVDFRAIKEIPKGFSSFLQKITTDDFRVTIAIKGGVQVAPTITFQNGIELTFGSQKEPIKLQTFGTIEPTGTFSFGGKMPSMIELAIFSIGDMGVEFIVDPKIQAALAVLGVPFSGIGLRGRIDLGKDAAKRASLESRSKFVLTGDKLPNFIMNVIGKNLDFSHLVYLLAQGIAKVKGAKPVPKDVIPTIKFSKFIGKLAPWGGSVAGKTVDPGFTLDIDATLFDKNFGLYVDLSIPPSPLALRGQGWMPPITLKRGKTTFFEFSGAGKDQKWGTADDSPYVQIDFDPMKAKFSFGLTGKLSIPPLALESKTTILFARHRFQASIDSKMAGFTTAFNVNIDPAKWREMEISFRFRDDFDEFLSKMALPAFSGLLGEAQKEINKTAQEMQQATTQATSAQAKGRVKLTDEARKIQNDVNQLNSQIAQLKKECEDASLVEKIVVCPKTELESIPKITELAAKQVYLQQLLTPATKVVEVAEGVTKKLPEVIATAQEAFNKAKDKMNKITTLVTQVAKAGRIFKVKEASGSVSMKQLIAGQIPLMAKLVVEIRLPKQKPVTVTLKSVPFDFKNAAKSAKSLAEEILKQGVTIFK